MKRFLTIIVLLHSSLLFAQQQQQAIIDSLVGTLATGKDNATKELILHRISYDYRLIDPDQGLRYAQMELDLAEQSGRGREMGLAYGAFGINYQYKSDYPNAFEYDFKALKKYEEAGDKKGMATIYMDLGNLYQYEKNYTKVLEYDHKALKISEELGDKQGIATNLSNIGIFYFSQNDYDSALVYHSRALHIQLDLGYTHSAAIDLSNIGDVYMHKKEYAKALENDFKALTYLQQEGDKYSTAITLGNIGEAYLAMAQDTTAGRKVSGSAGDVQHAIEFLEKAIDASRPIGQLDNIIEFSQYLSDAYALTGNYRAALTHYKEYSIMNDSVYSSQNNLKIKQSEHQHDLELKDRDIKIAELAVAKKKNEQVFFIAGIVLLLLVIVIVLRNYRMQKITNKLLSKEKKRSDDLLLNILPAEVAEELKEKGAAEAKYFDNVTVMFTDFVDFTKAGERMSPQQLVNELNFCFKAFDDIIRRYNIEKIKTVGDAYLAVTGLPLANPDHAATMVQVALDISHFMKARREKLGDDTFEVRIGVHSGNVVAGIVGIIKFSYDIWGDTVNTAARMEQNSAPGKINISQTTYELVQDKFTCSFRGEIIAKNKGNLKMYFVDDI